MWSFWWYLLPIYSLEHFLFQYERWHRALSTHSLKSQNPTWIKLNLLSFVETQYFVNLHIEKNCWKYLMEYKKRLSYSNSHEKAFNNFLLWWNLRLQKTYIFIFRNWKKSSQFRLNSLINKKNRAKFRNPATTKIKNFVTIYYAWRQ